MAYYQEQWLQCVPINQASNFLFYFHSEHVAEKSSPMHMLEGGSGVLGVLGCRWPGFSEARDLLGALLSYTGTRLTLELCGPASSGPVWDLDDGLCFRGAGMEDRTQDGERGCRLRAPSASDARSSFATWGCSRHALQGHGCEKQC